MQHLSLFRPLSDDEIVEFQAAARRSYTPGEPIDETWHPVCRAECERMNAEAVQKGRTP